MEHYIYTVYDQKAQAYLQIFTQPNDAMASRIFINCCQDPTHNFGRNPEDYTLLKIGVWSDTDAKLTATQIPETIHSGITAKAQNEPSALTDEAPILRSASGGDAT